MRVHCLFTYIPRVERLDTTAAAIGCCRTIGIPRGKTTVYIYGYRAIIIRSTRVIINRRNRRRRRSHHSVMYNNNIIYDVRRVRRGFVTGERSERKTKRESHTILLLHTTSYTRYTVSGIRAVYSVCAGAALCGCTPYNNIMVGILLRFG
jgi:hypothetical protein